MHSIPKATKTLQSSNNRNEKASNASKSIDSFLDRVPGADYNCMDFTREVWLYLTGEDVVEKLKRLEGSFLNRKVTLSGLKGFTKLARPISPCFAVMQRFKFVPHVGIYIDDRILHMHDKGVALREPNIAQSYYQRIVYYR
jgi:hypothetical protein